MGKCCPTCGQKVTGIARVTASSASLTTVRMSQNNQDMVAAITEDDGDQATSTTVADSPVAKSPVQVFLNGVLQKVGNGTKSAPFYFSGDNGATARSFSTGVQQGDKLYYNGSLQETPFQLGPEDRISLVYLILSS